jgi:hypothetical protein
MIESFLYGTWICGQGLYWFFLRHETALHGEECWRMLSILTWRDVQRRESSCRPVQCPAAGGVRNASPLAF